MEFPEKYKALENNSFSKGSFSLVPIRFEDRIATFPKNQTGLSSLAGTNFYGHKLYI